ncbi:MAG: conserved repeat domain protein [Polaromonas sp.]|nr:conserved repeat domain protein [Polaromonas sp.]
MAQPTVAASKAATSSVAPAAAKAVLVELTQFKVIKNAKGVEQLVAAPAVLPGDVIEYKVTYKNTSAKAVEGLVADLPIPEGLEYLPKSAKPGAALVKAVAKDGQYAAEPLMRKLPDNKSELVPYNEYRALRWNLGQLPAGAEAAVTARAKVEAVVPPALKTVPASAPSSAITVKPASAAR